MGLGGLPLILGQPYAFCCLSPFTLRHEFKVGPKQVAQERRFASGLRAKHGDQMVVESGLGDFRLLQIHIEIGTGRQLLTCGSIGTGITAYLNSFSSSITCMPCSYCCFVASPPTEAKWPFMVMTEGAVGNLEATDGRRSELPFVLGDAMI